MHPAANLTDDQLALFQQGTSPFDFEWDDSRSSDRCTTTIRVSAVTAASAAGRAQIGGDGVIDINGPQSEALVRCQPARGRTGVSGRPGAGPRLRHAAPGPRDQSGSPEVTVTLTWNEHVETFGDGEEIGLREPRLDAARRQRRSDAGRHAHSYRIAPAIIGLGLLEAVDERHAAARSPIPTTPTAMASPAASTWCGTRCTARPSAAGSAGRRTPPTLHDQAAGAFVERHRADEPRVPGARRHARRQDDQLEEMAFLVSTVAVPAAAPRDARRLARPAPVRRLRVRELPRADAGDRRRGDPAARAPDDPSVHRPACSTTWATR